LKLAENMGLDAAFVKSLYMLLHDESIRIQVEVMRESKKEQPVA
jgi:hypothetical protein